MFKNFRFEIAYWTITAFLLGLLVRDAFSNSQGSWLAGTLLSVAAFSLQKGLSWSLKFEGFARAVRIFLAGVLSLYLAYLSIAFVYWYFLGLDPHYFEKSIINPILLWAVMGFFAGLYFYLFQKTKHQQEKTESIEFYSNRMLVSIQTNEILFIESLGDHTMVHLVKGEPLKNGIKISEWTVRLPDFLRTHRSFLVNKQYAMYKGQNLELQGIHQIPISRKYKENVRSVFLKEDT